jgi:hypothetical protein
VCAVREENQKTYYMPADNSGEKLLYDFSKTLGDSVEVVSMGLNYPGKIKLKIDGEFTTTINGIDRKTYLFKANGSYHTQELWYEGIGSSFGFLTPFLSVSDNINTLKCNSKNDTLYYFLNDISSFLCLPGEPTNSCEYTKIATGIEHRNKLHLDIYPNPASDKICFNYNFINAKYKIVNMQAQEILFGKIMSNTINISTLNKGIYFLEIEENNKHYYTKVNVN